MLYCSEQEPRHLQWCELPSQPLLQLRELPNWKYMAFIWAFTICLSVDLETGNVRKGFLFYFRVENADTQRGQKDCRSEDIVYNWKEGSTILVYHSLNIKHPPSRSHSEAETDGTAGKNNTTSNKKTWVLFPATTWPHVAQNHLWLQFKRI